MLVVILARKKPVLRAVKPQDMPFLYHVASEYPESWSRLCLQGTPSPQQFETAVSDQVLAQFIVGVLDGGEQHALGLVSLYKPDFVGETVWVESVGLPEEHHRRVRDDALIMIIERAFTAWPMRKVYGVHHSYEAPIFSGVQDVEVEEEVRLRGVTLHEGMSWDRVLSSIRRDRWLAAQPGVGAR